MKPDWQKLLRAQPGLMGIRRFVILFFLLTYILEHFNEKV